MVLSLCSYLEPALWWWSQGFPGSPHSPSGRSYCSWSAGDCAEVTFIGYFHLEISKKNCHDASWDSQLWLLCNKDALRYKINVIPHRKSIRCGWVSVSRCDTKNKLLSDDLRGYFPPLCSQMRRSTWTLCPTEFKLSREDLKGAKLAARTYFFQTLLCSQNS